MNEDTVVAIPDSREGVLALVASLLADNAALKRRNHNQYVTISQHDSAMIKIVAEKLKLSELLEQLKAERPDKAAVRRDAELAETARSLLRQMPWLFEEEGGSSYKDALKKAINGYYKLRTYKEMEKTTVNSTASTEPSDKGASSSLTVMEQILSRKILKTYEAEIAKHSPSPELLHSIGMMYSTLNTTKE